MGKKLGYFFMLFFAFFMIKAQELPKDFKNMTKEQRLDLIRNLTPEERKNLMFKMKSSKIIKELDIPTENQEAFRKLYLDYMNDQHAIREKFKPATSHENLSDADARLRINQSFEVAQQLLNNRKLHTERFLKILKPQQVLQLHHLEKRMHENFMKGRGQGMGMHKGPGMGKGMGPNVE